MPLPDTGVQERGALPSLGQNFEERDFTKVRIHSQCAV